MFTGVQCAGAIGSKEGEQGLGIFHSGIPLFRDGPEKGFPVRLDPFEFQRFFNLEGTVRKIKGKTSIIGQKGKLLLDNALNPRFLDLRISERSFEEVRLILKGSVGEYVGKKANCWRDSGVHCKTRICGEAQYKKFSEQKPSGK